MAAVKSGMIRRLCGLFGTDQEINDQIAILILKRRAAALLSKQREKYRFGAKKELAKRRRHDMRKPRIKRVAAVRLPGVVHRQLKFRDGLPETIQNRIAVGAGFGDQEVDDKPMVVRIITKLVEKYSDMASDAFARRAALTVRNGKACSKFLRDFDRGRLQ